jgi:hypothetical protein
MDKQESIAILRRELEFVIAERRTARTDPAAYAARIALRHFQSQRMADTHADMLKAPGTRAAAQFFLSDLYGPDDLAQRDASLERIVPTMERLLPAAALAAVAEAVALDALSERLDGAMALQLGEKFTREDYIAAYRKTATRADRERQLRHIESVGMALCDLVGIPLIGSTLAMMRGPAKMAHLGDLHNFLERGFKAFKGMRDPHAFVATIVRRESVILSGLYAGKENPFALEAMVA